MERYGECADWAEREFGGAELGDVRRTERLVQIACGAASQVGAALSTVCGKSGSQAATRVFGRDETTIDAVTAPHIKQTSIRCSGLSRILAVQDTSSLDLTTHKSTQGLGPISTCEHSRGLLMHSALAVSEQGLTLGLLGIQVWARDQKTRGCAKNRRERPVSDKESNKWLVGLEQIQSSLQEGEVLVVADRESDVYAYLIAPRREGVELLVRLSHNRAVEDEEYSYVLDALNGINAAGEYEVEIPRQGARKARAAKLEVRIAQVTLKPPRHRSVDVADVNIAVSVIKAAEKDAPDGVEPVEWTLLTTELVDDLKAAKQMIQAYTQRWVIEEYHRVLKSGCRVEQMQYDTMERFLPALGIQCVVAWRVLHLTKQSRIRPTADAKEVASKEEVEVLSLWLKSQREKCWKIATAKDFTIAVARMGGFLGRKSDGMPGTKTIWQGLRSLEILMLGHRLATRPSEVIQD